MKALKFYATWCGPCKVLTNTLKSFEGCPVEEVNIEENDELVEKYGIRNVPVLIFVDDDGNERKRLAGNVPLDTINKTFEEASK